MRTEKTFGWKDDRKVMGKRMFLVVVFLVIGLGETGAGAVVSDDFSGEQLNEQVWSFENPLGDAGYALSGTGLVVYIPGGVSHDIWTTSNNAPRIVQVVEDGDFEVEAKYNSELDLRYQMQGILVEQDTGNFLRFDFYFDGVNVRLYSASFTDGSVSVMVNKSITKGAPYYLRVHREGIQWILMYSYDGVTWLEGISFERALAVTSIGVYFANYAQSGTIPAFTGELDYFFNTAAPIAPQDVEDPNENRVTIITLGEGTVEEARGDCLCGVGIQGPMGDVNGDCRVDFRDYSVMSSHWMDTGENMGCDLNDDQVVNLDDVVMMDSHWLTDTLAGCVEPDPNLEGYHTGEVLVLTAVPGVDFRFVEWSGAVASPDNPALLTCGGQQIVVAKFVTTVVPPPAPVISNIVVVPGTRSATITWQTDTPATSTVRWGTTTGYELGETTDYDLVTGHSVMLTSLTAGTLYHYQITSVDDYPTATTTPDRVFSTSEALGPSGIASDEFIGEEMDMEVWTKIDPIGDSVFAMTGGTLSIQVPGGASHSPPMYFEATPEDLVLNLRFNDDPEDGVADSSLYQNDGVSPPANQPQLVAGHTGQAYDFDGNDDFVEIPDSASLDVDTITMAAWIYVHNYIDDQRIISKEYGTTAPYSIYSMLLDGAAEKQIEVRLGINGVRYRYFSATDVPLNQWVHVAATYDGSKTSIYINGALDRTASTATGPIQDNNRPVYIGASEFYPHKNFDGMMDEVRVYNRALTAEEIADLVTPENIGWNSGTANMAPRIMQTVTDGDFSIGAKFDVEPSEAYQIQGLVVEQDSDHFLRMDVFSDGAGVQLLGTCFMGDTFSLQGSVTLAGPGPYYLSIGRVTDQWTFRYSYDGAVWQELSNFVQFMTVQAVGVYAGNHGPDSTAPAFTSEIDYFYNTAPPAMRDIGAMCQSNVVTFYWTTETATIGRVEYGSSSMYELGVFEESGLFTEHSVTVAGLTEDALYHFRVISKPAPGDPDGKIGGTVNMPLRTKTLWREEFDGVELNQWVWTAINPLGDGEFNMDGNSLSIHVPGGVSHDIWTSGNRAPRIMMPVADEDFQIEAKFDSEVMLRYQMQGFIVEQDSTNFLRFDIYHDGSSVRILAVSLSGGTATVKANKMIQAGAPYYLSLLRMFDQWTLYYSYDREVWGTVVQFDRAMTVQSVGVFAANHGIDGQTPEFTGVIDYFTSSTMPLVYVDDPNVNLVRVKLYGEGTVEHNPEKPDYLLGEEVELTAVPAAGWKFAGWADDAAGQGNPAVLTISGDHVVTALFDPLDSDSFIQIWHGPYQVFGHLGNPQRWVNILGHIVNPAEVTYLTYALNGVGQLALSMGPVNPRLDGGGDFNAEILYSNLHEGINHVRIIARLTSGREVTQTVLVEYASGNVWPLPYAIDWSTVESIHDVVQVVDGQWELTASGIRTIVPYYDRLLTIGDMAWDDYEVTVPVTVHETLHDPNQVGNTPGLGILMRWTGHYDWGGGAQPRIGWWPMGALGWFRWFHSPTTGAWRIIGNEETRLVELTGPGAPLAEIPYVMKMRVETLAGKGGLYRFKVWPQGGAEPAGWLMQALEGLSDPQNGSFMLVAHNVDVTFGNVDVVPITDPMVPPPAPTSFTATPVSYNRIDLSWAGSPGEVDSYKIYRTDPCAVEEVITVSKEVISYVDMGLTGGTEYRYQIAAENLAGVGPKSEPVVVSTLPPPPLPEPPTEFAAEVMNYGRIDLSWVADPNVIANYSEILEYKIYRTDGDANEVVITVAGTETSYSDTGLTPETEYRYEISAVNVTGEGLRSAPPVVVSTPALPPLPGAPTGLAAEVIGHDRIDLTWDANPALEYVDNYKIYRTDESLNEEVIIIPGTSTSYSDTGLMENTEYSYRISAVNFIGEGPQSSPSVMATTLHSPLATPTGLTATPLSYERIDLSWDAHAEVLDAYRIYRTDASENEVMIQVAGTATSYSDSGLSADSEYRYRLTAVLGTVESPRSSAVVVSTYPAPLPDMVAYWKFDETSGWFALDSSYNGHNGTLQGAASFVPNGVNRVVSLDGGDNSRVDAGSFDVPTSTGLTLATWMRADDFDMNDQRIIAKTTGGSGAEHQYWMLSTVGLVGGKSSFRFRLKTDDGSGTYDGSNGWLTALQSDYVVSAGVWTHVAATWDGSSMRIYKDGVLIKSGNKGGNISKNSAVKVTIGNNPAGTDARAFDGLLDEVYIYQRALSQAEIQALISGSGH